MTRHPGICFALALCLLTACSGPARPAAQSKTVPRNDPPRITQLYATKPNLPRGEKGLVCYGVENSNKVSLEPPREELSAALARCVEVSPEATTTYTLTAEGPGGPPATQNLTVAVGAPAVHIVEVTVNSLTVKAGDAVSICFHAQNAARVTIEPVSFRSPIAARGCTVDNPRKTTTYVVTATGASGDQDQEHVTVKVK
jgi:hypothetical protein